MSKKLVSFFLVITDKDKAVFNVIGPIADDTSWNKRVCEAQEQGRDVNCHAVEENNKEAVITRARNELRLGYTDQPLV